MDRRNMRDMKLRQKGTEFLDRINKINGIFGDEESRGYSVGVKPDGRWL